MSALIEYKCPCCDGAIAFDSGLQKMKCPYCDQVFDLETLKKYDEELNKPAENKLDWDEYTGENWTSDEAKDMRVYSCKSCGGEIVGEATTAAMSCPYCGNPVVMTGQLSGELKPDVIIPFKLDKEAAKREYRKFYSDKKLVPKIFIDENHIDEIKGIYVPFWLFNCDAMVDITYDATKLHMFSDAQYNYTETEHYAVRRAGNLVFNNVPADASEKMPDDLMDALEPYDFDAAVDFQTAYLAGYLADRYDQSAEQCRERANSRIRASAENAFASTVTGYNSVSTKNTSINMDNGNVRYGLLPVWLLNTSCDGKKYIFAMNGQTGKFVGDLPVDNKKYWLRFALIAAGIAAVVFLITYLLFFS